MKFIRVFLPLLLACTPLIHAQTATLVSSASNEFKITFEIGAATATVVSPTISLADIVTEPTKCQALSYQIVDEASGYTRGSIQVLAYEIEESVNEDAQDWVLDLNQKTEYGINRRSCGGLDCIRFRAVPVSRTGAAGRIQIIYGRFYVP